jgi:methylase of polypeptide subunit release factors
VEVLQIFGVDISPAAVNLATRNWKKVRKGVSGSTNVEFARADVLEGIISSDATDFLGVLEEMNQPEWDIIISNPPYISPVAFNRDTTRSVRNFEPNIALVPISQTQGLSDQEQGDMFYPRLLEIAEHVSAKILLVEVADLAQAERVSSIAKSKEVWDGVEIWCDDPEAGGDRERSMSKGADGVEVVGNGGGRSVFCWRGDGGLWAGKS